MADEFTKALNIKEFSTCGNDPFLLREDAVLNLSLTKKWEFYAKVLNKFFTYKEHADVIGYTLR